MFWRDINGIIQVDRVLKLNSPEYPNFQPYWCNQASIANEAINNGQFGDPWGIEFIGRGNLELTDPNGDSPYYPGLTASSDITNYIVPGYSHADLWLGYDADEMGWSLLKDWLNNH